MPNQREIDEALMYLAEAEKHLNIIDDELVLEILAQVREFLIGEVQE